MGWKCVFYVEYRRSGKNIDYTVCIIRDPLPRRFDLKKKAEKPLKIAADIGKMKMGWTPLSNGGFIVP